MKRATECDRQRILAYLKDNIQDCLYLYIDISTNGVWNDNIHVWISEDSNGKLNLVLMEYYESVQLFFDDTAKDISPIVDYIKTIMPLMVSGKKTNIQRLSGFLDDYKVSFGKVYELESVRRFKKSGIVRAASVNDTKEIAELICKDENIGGHYSIGGLEAQLTNRINDGSGRSVVIEKDGKIIAHNATYAEIDSIAIVGGTIVDKEYRNGPWFFIIGNTLINQLCDEGKKVYTFSTSQTMMRYHDSVHKVCAEYGKLELISGKGEK